MSVNDKTPIPVSSPRRRAKRLRVIGIIVLALGLAAACLVYWLGTRDANLNDKLSMQGFNRAQQRQMGQLYGKSGQLFDEGLDDLKQPGTQAILIAGFSLAAFAGCRYFARLLDYDDVAA